MFRTQQRTIHEPLTTVKDATHKEAGERVYSFVGSKHLV